MSERQYVGGFVGGGVGLHVGGVPNSSDHSTHGIRGEMAAHA